jgi:hypothetical protein
LYPNAKLSIIVHSFGSYIIGKILERHYDLNIEKLILCGSVLETTYRWEDALNRRNIKKDNVINECGKKDIWPVLAKATSWGYGVSGTHGFGNVIVKDRFHDVTHGQYFQKEFISKYWKPFIHDGEYKRTPFETNRPTTPQWLSLLGILPIKSIVVILIVVLCLVFFRGADNLFKVPEHPVTPNNIVHLKPVHPTTVYIQIAKEEQREKAKKIQSSLQKEGFSVPGIENVGDDIGPRPYLPESCEIRYFSAGDKNHADRIENILRSNGINPVKEALNPKSSPTPIEIWFSPND